MSLGTAVLIIFAVIIVLAILVSFIKNYVDKKTE